MSTMEVLESSVQSLSGRSLQNGLVIRTLVRTAPYADQIASNHLLTELFATDKFAARAKDFAKYFALLWGERKFTPEQRERVVSLTQSAEKIYRDIGAYKFVDQSAVPPRWWEETNKSLAGLEYFWSAFSHGTEIVSQSMADRAAGKLNKERTETAVKVSICIKQCLCVLDSFPEMERKSFRNSVENDVKNALDSRVPDGDFVRWNDARVFGDEIEEPTHLMRHIEIEIGRNPVERTIPGAAQRIRSACLSSNLSANKLFRQYQSIARFNGILAFTVATGFVAAEILRSTKIAATVSVLPALIVSGIFLNNAIHNRSRRLSDFT